MTNLNIDKAKILSENLFPVVGVGASAGGLEAFKKLIKAVPEDSGMAYIIVQHLDPDHDSILTEILQRITKIPVQEVTDNIHVKPDHIYIIPSNKLLTATDGVLQLSPRLPKNQQNLPIDILFNSLAEVHQNHAIGVVLSGKARDGTLGLKSIRDQGGITIAQNIESAAYSEMPQNAIDAGVVDFILDPEQIPTQLLQLKSSLQNLSVIDSSDDHQLQDKIFVKILNLIRLRKGVDFTYYKQKTIRRRIDRRMALNMKGNIAEYLKYLKDNKEEQDFLFQDLLIPVTQFFRDPKTFENLCETVFPSLIANNKKNESLRIWIAGCSTGEEAYSMVICLQDFMTKNNINLVIQVFATDISESGISKARAGIYAESDMVGLSPEQVEQYFTKTDNKYRINKLIRDSCVFAQHNYLKDPPFAKIDLISCRNSLIYLEPFLQKKALTTFHYALKEKGFLVLGKSETVGQAADLFTAYDKVNKFYTRKPVKSSYLHVLDDSNEKSSRQSDNNPPGNENIKDDFQKSGDNVLLSKYVPPGVIINEEMDIVQFRGATGMWLEPAPGKPSSNLLKMARDGITFEIRTLLHKVKKGKAAQIKENIPFQFAGKEHFVTIEIIPLPDTIDIYYLVLFKNSTIVISADDDLNTDTNKKSKSFSRQKSDSVRIANLEKELAATLENIRTVTEEQEAANEELQSANEELLSGSEELQSLNEELETSKEEIQTSNEELIVVNQELYDRNEQLNLSRLYAESIVSTIREPLIILSTTLTVRSANPAFYTKFQVTEEEAVGKSLFELGKQQWDIPELKKSLGKIISNKTNITDYEIEVEFPSIGVRTILLNAVQITRDYGEEQSILVALDDITERKRKEKIELELAHELERKVFDRTFSLHEANSQLQLANQNLAQFTYISSHDLQEPVRKIKTFINALQENYQDALPDPAKVLIKKINTSSERISTLIQELLKFSQLLHHKAVFEPTNLEQIIAKVISDFDLLIAEKGATINCGPLPIIDAIPFQMTQLFFNLISNSLKFSREKVAPVISISSKILSLDEAARYADINPKYAYCEIEIKDNGVGFKQQFADQIFLLFRRLHNQEKYTGTGVGLALCKNIVSNHHGEITVTSRENRGTKFKIVLPLSR